MAPRLRIALLTYSTHPRGSVVHTLNLAEALMDLGHEIWVYGLDKDGRGFYRTPRCPVHLVPTQPAPAAIDELVQQRIAEFVTALTYETASYDVYHAQDCLGANALMAWKQHGGQGVVVRTVHHIEAFRSPYLQQCQLRSLYGPDSCFCVSQSWQRALATDYGIDARRVVNGVDLQRFSPNDTGQETAVKQRYGLTGWPCYLTVGGIEPRKNSLGLLQAFAQVLHRYPKAQLVIAGGATLFDYQAYREDFLTQVKTLGISVGQSLILPGVIPEVDLPALYRCADAFCFPSLTEGWGLVVLEAIASGCPVVVSDQPPFSEFLNRDQAFWVDPRDPATIATAMLQAVTRDRINVIHRSQAALVNYSWPRSAHQHVEHYRQLLMQRQEEKT